MGYDERRQNYRERREERERQNQNSLGQISSSVPSLVKVAPEKIIVNMEDEFFPSQSSFSQSSFPSQSSFRPSCGEKRETSLAREGSDGLSKLKDFSFQHTRKKKKFVD